MSLVKIVSPLEINAEDSGKVFTSSSKEVEFEKEFDIQIPDDQAENISTVGQAIQYIEEQLS